MIEYMPPYLPVRVNPRHVVCIDTETTGLNEKAEIVQLAIVDWNLKPLFYRLIKPMEKIPVEVSNIHRITDDTVANEKDISYYWDYHITNLIKDKIIIGYNVLYDIRMLIQSISRFGLENSRGMSPVMIIDVMQVYKICSGKDKFSRLQIACEDMEIEPLDNQYHDSLYDATMTMKLFQRLMEIQPQ